jgi:hypothetical protein
MTIAERIVYADHALVCELVVEEMLCFLDDSALASTDEPGCSGDYCFGAFGLVAEYEHRLAERRCFLLNSPRIGQQEICPAHQVYKRDVVHGIKKSNIRLAFQMPIDRPADARIGVNRVNDFDIISSREAQDGSANLIEAVAKAFAAVGCNDN